MKKPVWLDRRIAWPGPYLTLCLSEAEFRAVEKEFGFTISRRWAGPREGIVYALENRSGELCCVLCISEPERHTPIEIAGLIVHESVHVWQQYAKSIGEESPGDEQEAYAIQCIAQEFMQEYARRIGAKK